MPVIFVTSTDNLEVMRECVEAGGDDFMVKDADIKGYLERVGYWMDRRCLTPAERQAVLQMAGFVAEARASAPPEFGRQASEKLALLSTG